MATVVHGAKREIVYDGADLYPKQRDAIFDPARVSLIESSTKAGKAQPLDAIIYTPAGPRLLGDLHAGDELLTPTGRSRIIGVYPQGEVDLFRVTFSDGESALCSADHLWEVHSRKHGCRVLTLAEIKATSPHSRRLWWVPPANARFNSSDVPIDPWLLGAFLGDGGFTTAALRFSSTDADLLDRVESLLPLGYALKHTDRCNYHVNLLSQTTPIADRIITALRDLGLWGRGSHEKFVPPQYLYNSRKVRLEILRGILDTDGSVDKHGQPNLEQTSQRLASDVQTLVESLGGFVRTTTKRGSYVNEVGDRVQCKMVYRQRIVCANSGDFFWLQRKRVKCRDRGKPTRRLFRSIEFSHRAEARCIEIDDPRGLYLTDHFIPTHNTVSALAWLLEQALKTGSEGRNYWWIAPVYGQAEIGFRRMKRKVPKQFYKANESKLQITLINGAVITFRSGERPDGLYGEDVYAAVLDEASRMREAVWIAIRSTLTATRGPVRIIGNVRGRKNWFYQLCRIAEDGAEGMAYHRITAYDAAEAGVLSAEEVELARTDFERLGRMEVFDELYMAKASGGSSNPFGIDAIQACIIPYLSTNRPAVAGVDLAGRGAANIVERDERADRDYTAVVMLDREGNVCHLDRFQLAHGETEARILATVKRTACLMDSTGSGDPVVEWCQRTGHMNVLGFNFTPRSKQELMERLAIAIQNQEVHFPDGALVDELESFTFEHTRSGMRYQSAPGYHDDLVCALALAVWKMPWRRGYAAVPEGLPSSSRWTSDNGTSEAGRRYLESLKPTEVSGLQGAPDPAPPSVPLPMIVGSGSGKWH